MSGTLNGSSLRHYFQHGNLGGTITNAVMFSGTHHMNTSFCSLVPRPRGLGTRLFFLMLLAVDWK